MAFIIIILLLSALSFMTSSAQMQSGEGRIYDQVYYITASTSSSCPLEQSCLTISQFASNTSLYLMENTTLIFQDEIHTLDLHLLINDVNHFSAIAERMTINSTIIRCRNSFVFENLNDLYINGLLFIGCRNNHIKLVEQVSIENCTFDGQYDIGTALFIMDSTANITGCRFVRTLSIFSNIYLQPNDWYIVGGAVTGNHSDISIYESFFEESIAQNGGAVIFIDMECKLVITNTIFHQIQVVVDHNYLSNLPGSRAVYANSGCSIFMINSSFFENILSYSIFIGSYYNSTVLIQDCIFHNNYGNISFLMEFLDSNITLNKTLIEFNRMFGFVLVSSTVLPTYLEICNSTFNANDNIFSGVAMQALYADSSCSVLIVNSTFSSLRLTDDGGVLVESYNSFISIQDSTFCNNSGNTNFLMDFLDSNITINKTLIEFNNLFGLVLVTSQFLPPYLKVCNSMFNINDISSGVVMQAGYNLIVNSTFFANTLNYGALISSYSLNILIQECTFHNNSGGMSVLMDFVNSNITLQDIKIEFNIMLLCISVSNWSLPTSFEILNSVFNSNDASGSIVQIGCLISDCNTFTALVENSHFVANKISVTFLGYLTGSIQMQGCMFIGNRAQNATMLIQNGTVHLNNCIFDSNSAQYGAVVFAINCSATVSETQITNNIADTAGILLINNGNLTSYAILVLNNTATRGVIALTSCSAIFEGSTTLINNKGSLYAVASDLIFEGSLSIANCTPLLSQVIPINEGGAITIFQSSAKFTGNVTLTNNNAENGGALLVSESRVSFSGQLTISNNLASQEGGGIYLYQSRLNIQGQCRLTDNVAQEGGGIYGLSSTITLEDVQNSLYSLSTLPTSSVIVFEHNSAKLGGALYLASHTNIYTLLIASFVHQINFTENIADYGGAVYIADETDLRLCNSSGSITSLQTECFIQILALYPLQLNDAIELQGTTLNFLHNNATLAGEAIFGGLFDRCTVSQLNPKRQQGLLTQGHLYLKSISNLNSTDLMTSNPVRLCFCYLNQPECSLKPSSINVTKGQTFNVSLVAVDQVNHTLASNVTALLSSNDGGLGEGQQYQSLENRCTNLSYNVFTSHNSDELLMNAVGPCGSAHLSQSRVQLTFLDCTCPIGFQPVAASLKTDCRCECHSNITKYVEVCNSSTKNLKMKANTWISNIIISGLGESYLLVHPHCPYDYCNQDVTVNLNQINGTDSLCAFQRRGTLCGACRSGYSLSFGSSQCIKCKSYWPVVLIGIILLTIIAGIALVSALLYLELTVAIGTLNGIIFYANIINGNASMYFNGLTKPNFPSLFVAWLNLDIGFDVCLFKGIDAAAKTWLQLVFPIYLVMLVVLVIVISMYSQRFSNLIGKKNPVATLATLILLSYAKILSIVITMLSLTKLDYPDGQKTLWKPDATVAYLQFPKHIFLFLTAILILVVGAAYTIVLFFWQWLVHLPDWKVFHCMRNPKLLSFAEAYNAPFKPKHRYWTGLLLLVRVMLYLISALNTTRYPQVPLIATMIVTGSLLVLSTSVYKKNLVGNLEIAIIYNIFILTAVTWYTMDISTNSYILQKAAIHISTVTVFVFFFFIIVYHSCMYTRIYSIVEKTTLFAKLSKLRFFKQQLRNKPPYLNLQVEARDVDIFELVDKSPDTNDYQLAQPQPEEPSPEPPKYTTSVIETPKHKNQKSKVEQDSVEDLLLLVEDTSQ